MNLTYGNDIGSLPSLYASFRWSKSFPVMSTHTLPSSSCPQWSYERTLRFSNESISLEHLKSHAVIVSVWHRPGACMYANRPFKECLQEIATTVSNAYATFTPVLAGDQWVGVARVDLCGLAAGMNCINGWHDVVDVREAIRGQIKVCISVSLPKMQHDHHRCTSDLHD